MSLLAVAGLTVRHGAIAAVRDVSFAVEAGEIVALVGESGSGKSSIAWALLGLLPPAGVAGSIRVDGQEIVGLDERRLIDVRGAGIGMIFQEPGTALDPLMTIGRQVAEVLERHRGLPRRVAAGQAAALLVRVGLDQPATRYPHQLSGGQRQRVVIAIAIAAAPRLLVADEPTTALDATTQAHVVALLAGLAREGGMGLLLVSHDLALVAGVADRIIVLHEGRLVEQGTAGEVLCRPQAAHSHALVAAAALPPRTSTAAGETILTVDGLTRCYGARRAVDDVSLTLARGETLGIAGESGSGKSTLLRAILGLDPYDGVVRLAGARFTGQRRLRPIIQAVFQDPGGSLDPAWTVERIVAEPLGLDAEQPDAAARRGLVADALAEVGLAPEFATRRPAALSGGERQRVAIARALILRPALILFDEALTSLDATRRAEILVLLDTLQRRHDLAYLFVGHDLGLMRAATDRLMVMRDGRVVEAGPTSALLADPRDPYTVALVAASVSLSAGATD